MTFEQCLIETIEMLRRQKRVSYRALKRQFGIDDAFVDDLKSEIVEVLELALDHEGRMLVWKGGEAEVGAAVDAAAMPESPEAPGGDKPQDRAPMVAPMAAPMAGAERRQLTVMFCDLVGSTELSAQLDPEDLRDVLRQYQDETAAAIRRFEGFVAQYLGDGMLIYFGYPSAHEDDAERAIRAGLEILVGMQDLNRAHFQGRSRLSVRIGIHTGQVVVSEVGSGERREHLALGETPNVAAKLQASAEPDALLITAATRRLVEDKFMFAPTRPLELRGRAEPIDTFRVLGLRDAEQGPGVMSAAPVLGRGTETQLLRECWTRSKEGIGQVVLLRGEAGIGKSRLVGSLREQIAAEAAACITFRCSPYFANSALHPVITHLHQFLGFTREDSAEARLTRLERALQDYAFTDTRTVALFAALLSVPVPADRYPPLELSPPELKRLTADALTAWLIEETRRHPIFVVFEDLHWADPSLVELLTLLVEKIPAVPMLLLLVSRPEFRSPQLWDGRSHVSQLKLGRFMRADTEALVSRLLRGKSLPAEVVRHIVDKTDGVPLFIEELLKTILESGMVNEESGAYRLTGPLLETAIPTTLQDSLMARLDRMASAREIAQIAATLGREFSYDQIRAMALVDPLALDQGLARLVEADLIYSRGTAQGAHYVFKHALIRDAAYQSLLKSRRGFFNDRIARVMDARFPEIRETQPELLAHHYTEAGLTDQAADCWQRAAQRAIERSAYVEAIHHLDTALRLSKTLPVTGQSTRRELLLLTSYGLALTPTRGYAAPELEETYTRAHELSRQIGEEPEILPLLNGMWSFYLVRAKYQAAQELGEQMLRLAGKSDSPVARIQANRALGVSLLYSGELEPGLAHIEKANALYDPERHCAFAFRLNGLDLGVSVRSFAAWGAWLLGRPARALQRNEEMQALARKVDHPYNSAWVLTFSPWIHQMRREVAQTLAQTEAGIAFATDHGFVLFRAMGTILHGWALSMSGRTEDGIEELRRGMEGYFRTGADSSRVHWSVLLAEAHLAAGQVDEGLRVLKEAEDYHSGERYYEAELHRMRGELHLARADGSAAAASEGRRCFEQALQLAHAQGAKSLELRAAMSLARLARRHGGTQPAGRALAAVYATFSEGFDTADLQETAALLKAS